MLSTEIKTSGNPVGRVKLGLRSLAPGLASKLGQIYFTEVKEVTAERRLSKSQLKKLDYPYSTRYPKDYQGFDDRLINRQSGGLFTSLRRTTVKGKDGAQVVVWVANPRYRYLLTGTEKMRQRNFMELAYERAEPKMKKAQKEYFDKMVPAGKKE